MNDAESQESADAAESAYAAAAQAEWAGQWAEVKRQEEEMLETAVLFSKGGVPQAGGIGVMASSGGAAVMAADKADEVGVELPSPAGVTRAVLARVVPEYGSTENPCDLTAESLRNVQMYGDCIRAFAEDPGFAAVVVPMMSAQNPTTVDRARYLSTLADELDKPICLVWLNEWLQGPGSEVYDASPRISMFRSMTRCMKALRHWLDWHARRPRLLAGGDSPPAPELGLAERALVAHVGAHHADARAPRGGRVDHRRRRVRQGR